MTRFARTGPAGLALAIVASAALAGAASATTYRGSGLDDTEMPVKVKLTGRDLIFDYTDIRVSCSDGSEPRQGGASHADVLNEHGRFKDKIEVGGATSVVKGKVRRNKAVGTITYDLLYDGGECHSGQVQWKAKRKDR